MDYTLKSIFYNTNTKNKKLPKMKILGQGSNICLVFVQTAIDSSTSYTLYPEQEYFVYICLKIENLSKQQGSRALKYTQQFG